MSALEASVTLDDVFAVALAKRVPLAPELAGYLTLEIADGARASAGEIDPRTVYVSDEGTVALVRQPKKDAGPHDAEASLRAILARLLDASGSATPALAVAARKRPGEGVPALIGELEAALIPVNRAAGKRALARLARAVKRVTLGVGRNASMPAVRGSSPSFTEEATTVRRDGALPADAVPESAASIALPPSVDPPEPRPPAPSQSTLGSPPSLFRGDEVESLLDTFGVSSLGESNQHSQDLKAIAGLDPTPPPPSASAVDALLREVGPVSERGRPAARGSTEDADSVEALLALTDATAPPPIVEELGPLDGPVAEAPRPKVPSSPSSARLPAPESRSRASVHDRGSSSDLEAAIQEAEGRRRPRRRTDSFERVPTPPRAPKTAMALVALLLLVLLASAGALWKWKPSYFTGRRSAPLVPAATTTNTAAPPPRCKGALVVTDAPPNAEILVRMGTAPLDVERMPVGARLEFIATAEGYAPRRGVVKSDAVWDRGPDDKPRLEVPIQLDASKAKPGGVDPWPKAEAGSEVGGPGAPGTVRVVSNIRGAEVWLLAGLGPRARIEPVDCTADLDVLLAGPPTLRRHLHVRSEEFASAQADAKGTKTVTLSAK